MSEEMMSRAQRRRAAEAAAAPTAASAPRAARAVPLPGRTLLLHLGLAVLLLVALNLLLLAIHSDVQPPRPDTETKTQKAPVSASTGEKTAKEDLAATLDVFAGNLANSALSDLVYSGRIIYRIPENDLVAPKPDESKYLVTSDPHVIQGVVDSASELLEGQPLIWNRNIERMEGTDMRCYCDETILVITWKEVYNGGVATFAEIKIADGSQLRRALSGNTFGGDRMLASKMAEAANAVIAINGDFYDNRTFGLSIYQRQICRNKTPFLDCCFFTASGDMLMTRRGELSENDEIEDYIDENDVVFGISFGPVLIEDGVLQEIPPNYPVGEIDAYYSRAAIAQKGERHYLLMTIGQEGPYETRCPLSKAAELIFSKGVDKAYALDGGQTATIVMHGSTVNRVDWDEERTMSDIIYFATALPEGRLSP